MKRIHDQIKRARRLAKSGFREEAQKILVDLTDSGSVEPFVELAKMARSGSECPEDIAQWIERAESSLNPHDSDGHFALHRAYTQLLGTGTPEVQRAKAFHHLLQAAGSGEHPRDMLSVAHHYRFGLNDAPVDFAAAESWYVRAGRTGDSEAIRECYEFFEEIGKPAPKDIPRVR